MTDLAIPGEYQTISSDQYNELKTICIDPSGRNAGEAVAWMVR
jgi:hypothetical protein